MSCDCENVKMPETIPYAVHELMMVRLQEAHKEEIERSKERERHHIKEKKYLWITIIVLASMLFASWMGFMIYESQFEKYSYDYDQNGEGVNIIGDENEVIPNESTFENKN